MGKWAVFVNDLPKARIRIREAHSSKQERNTMFDSLNWVLWIIACQHFHRWPSQCSMHPARSLFAREAIKLGHRAGGDDGGGWRSRRLHRCIAETKAHLPISSSPFSSLTTAAPFFLFLPLFLSSKFVDSIGLESIPLLDSLD